MKLKIEHLMPILIFISASFIILTLDFNWNITIFEKNIIIMPLFFSIIFFFLIIWIIKNQSFFKMKYKGAEVNYFLLFFIVYFIIILIVRQLMLWKYNTPYEKMPLLFLIILHILLLEKVCLSDYGLHIGNIKKNFYFTFFFILGIIIILLIPTMILALSFKPISQLFIYQLKNLDFVILLSLPFQIFAVGFSEELFFRGYLFNNLKKKFFNIKFNNTIAILLSSFIFGIFHISWYINYSSSSICYISSANLFPMIFHIIFAFLIGIIMCLIYQNTKSLFSPILLHGILNTSYQLFIPGTLSSEVSIALSTTTLNNLLLLCSLCCIFIIIFIIFILKLPGLLTQKLNY
jgi:membrane protease YdiL (CAAX protease family)